ETFREAGVPCQIGFPIRVQQNASLYGVMHFLDNGDDNLLKRLNLDPNGALYKVYTPLTNAYGGSVEKKTRKNEDNADLQSLINNLKLGGMPLRQYLYDSVDVPEVINF